MKILNLAQGTQEWHEARANAFTASEAPIMMSASPFKTREQYLKEKALGIKEEISPFLQKKFDEGHEAEKGARALLEAEVGDEFYPVVGEVELEGLRLLASFDGLTMCESCVWEHKLWNEKKAAEMTNQNELLPEYYWQLEHQLLVSGAQDAIFQMSDGIENGNKFEISYASVPERRKMLIEGWKQFSKDLASYEAQAEPQTATTQDLSLPEIAIEVVGQVKASNLPAVKSQVFAMIDAINERLETDDDFAIAESQVKELQKAEKALEAAKTKMLEGTADINEILCTLDELKDASRVKRLTLSKLVKERKEFMKSSIIVDAARELQKHVENLNRELPVAMPTPKNNFAEAAKGKKLFSSIRESVADALSQAKVSATLKAQEVSENAELFSKLADGYESLFNDKSFFLYDDPEQLENRVLSQISRYQAEQEHRAQIQAAAEMEEVAEKSQPIEQPQPEAQEVNETKGCMSETRYALIGLGCSPALSLQIENAIKAGEIPNVQYQQVKAA